VVVVPAPAERDDITLGPPRVLAIDRQELFLAAISRMLAGPRLNAEIVTSTRSDMALELVMAERFDLVVCECRGQPEPGRALLARLALAAPALPLIMIGDSGDEQQLVKAFKEGAAGIFTKRSLSAEFLEGAATVLAGHRAVAGELVGYLISAADSPVPRSEWSNLLSPTEIGILTMLGEARSIAWIAAARGISQKTVRNHVATIYRKMGLRNRIEAVLCAVRIGLVSEKG